MHLSQNTPNVRHDDWFENVLCNILAILSGPKCGYMLEGRPETADQ